MARRFPRGIPGDRMKHVDYETDDAVTKVFPGDFFVITDDFLVITGYIKRAPRTARRCYELPHARLEPDLHRTFAYGPAKRR
ncbi:hypothetical protein [Streptomyces sp. NPDC002057]|uniref:hypothetical protein n=1 Tax=Streptomyces sp. NPDC002057 TaxID=3154664 RepID=UPI00332CF0DD